MGAAGAVRLRGPRRVALASLDDRIRTCARALARRGDQVAQLRATRPAGLRGQVVLVNFWTLTCINWLRQEPYVVRGRRPIETTGWS
jgi:hypothetical protein